MFEQDWKQVVFRKSDTKVTSRQENAKTINNQSVDENKLFTETETFHHKKVSTEDGKKIQRARLDAKLTQAQLAQKINIQVKDINDLENGKAIYNGNILSKVKKVLQIK